LKKIYFHYRINLRWAIKTAGCKLLSFALAILQINETQSVFRNSGIHKLLTLVFIFPFVVIAQTEPKTQQQDTASNKAVEGVVRMMNTVSSGTQGTITALDTNRREEKPGMLTDLINYHAEDSMNIVVQTSKAYLYGNAHIDYGDISLDAGYIELDWSTNTVFARGVPDSTGKMVELPVFKQGDDKYETEEIRYNFTSQKAHIKSVVTTEGDSYLHGNIIKRVDQNTFYIQGTAFTTCNKRHPHFHVGTERAKVLVGKRIITGPANLVISDIPTPIVLPFGFFPAQDKRSSGFIMPTYNQHQGKGFGLVNGGYYFSLSDYYDLSLTGEIYSRGGWGATARSNYRKRYAFSGNVEARYNHTIIGDPRYAEFGEYINSKDFRLRWSHVQDPKARPDLTFSASVDLQNPGFNQLNAMNDNTAFLQNTTNSNINVSKKWLGTPFTLNASANQSQNNINKDFTLSLPRASLNMARIFPFASKGGAGSKKWYERIGMTYAAQTEVQVRGNLDSLSSGVQDINNTLRSGLQNVVSLSTNEQILGKITFSPSINVRNKIYGSSLNSRFDEDFNLIQDTVRGLSMVNDFDFSAALTTKVFGMFVFKKGKVKAIRHMVTPQVNFRFQPDFRKSFWGNYQTLIDSTGTEVFFDRHNRFLFGGSAAGSAGSANFLLGNNFEMKVRSNKDSTGERKVKIIDRLNFNTTYNMNAPMFSWSPINVVAGTSIIKNKVNLTYQGVLDMYGYDPELRRRVNKSALEVNGVLLRNTNTNFSVGTGWQGNVGGERAGALKTSSLGIEDDDPDWYAIEKYMAVSIPWSINLDYNLLLSRPNLETTLATHAITVNGSLKPTQNWSFVFSTGYDLVSQQVTYTQINVVRDLHCWEMRISWVPFGFNQMYMLGLNIKASSFKDAKLERRRNRGDF